DLHLRVAELRRLVAVLGALRLSANLHKVKPEHEGRIYKLLMESTTPPPGISRLGEVVSTYQRAMPDGWPAKEQISNLSGILSLIRMTSQYAVLWGRISETVNSAPSFDYVSEKARLETLHASRMSLEIDQKFVKFVDNNRALARSLGAVI